MATSLLQRSPGLRRGYHELPGLIARMTGDEKHDPSSYSTLDVVWVLYDEILRVDPADPQWADRDYFILSKGHGPLAYYATLAAKGFFDEDVLDTFGDFDSPLGHHPDANLIPGVEFSSGSLGHGLPVAVGVALGLDAQGRSPEQRVIILVGDGELDEGSNHEAIPYAGRAGLGRLTVVVVDNSSASYGWPGGIGARFEVEGWEAQTVNGDDRQELARALKRRTEHPNVVVAKIGRKL